MLASSKFVEIFMKFTTCISVLIFEKTRSKFLGFFKKIMKNRIKCSKIAPKNPDRKSGRFWAQSTQNRQPPLFRPSEPKFWSERPASRCFKTVFSPLLTPFLGQKGIIRKSKEKRQNRQNRYIFVEKSVFERFFQKFQIFRQKRHLTCKKFNRLYGPHFFQFSTCF